MTSGTKPKVLNFDSENEILCTGSSPPIPRPVFEPRGALLGTRGGTWWFQASLSLLPLPSVIWDSPTFTRKYHPLLRATIAPRRQQTKDVLPKDLSAASVPFDFEDTRYLVFVLCFQLGTGHLLLSQSRRSFSPSLDTCSLSKSRRLPALPLDKHVTNGVRASENQPSHLRCNSFSSMVLKIFKSTE